MPKLRDRFSMRGFFAGFFEEDLAAPPGKGAGAVFFPFGAYEARYHLVPLAGH